MATADLLLELMLSWIQQREDCAKQLRKLASELESLRAKCTGGECIGSSVSVVGAACLIGAGAATLFTGGAAAPFLGLLGATYTGVGVTISVAAKITEHFVSSDTMKEAQKIEEKSNDIGERIQNLFQQLKEELRKMSPNADPDELDGLVMTHMFRAMARRSGLTVNIHIDTLDGLKRFSNSGLGNSNFQQGFFRPELMIGLFGILAFFTFKGSGKSSKLLLAEGGKQLIKQLSTAGAKTALKGGAMVVGGAVGMAFALPEAIDSWKDLIKNNHVTEASQSLRDTARDIEKMAETLKKQLDDFKRMFEELAEVKNCIENPNRTSRQKQKLIDFVIKHCPNAVVIQWLKASAKSDVFLKLVDMFVFLEKELQKEKEKIRCKDKGLGARKGACPPLGGLGLGLGGDIDITFVAHGGIEGPMIPACCLVPLSTIKDVVLYSPWNCAIDAKVAYGIATGSIQPQHRDFFCCHEDEICQRGHRPTNLPGEWNSMKRAGSHPIPNIMVSTLTREDGAWKEFEILQDDHGPPGWNRVLIPFILPGNIHLEVPFFVVTLALSVVLLFSGFRATVHLAACLSGTSEGLLPVSLLRNQYAYTIDETGMTSLENFSEHENTELYKALKDLFG